MALAKQPRWLRLHKLSLLCHLLGSFNKVTLVDAYCIRPHGPWFATERSQLSQRSFQILPYRNRIPIYDDGLRRVRSPPDIGQFSKSRHIIFNNLDIFFCSS